MHHPLVGDLTLVFEMLDLPSEPGLSLLTCSAEPGSPSEDAMREPARWSEPRTRLSAADSGSCSKFGFLVPYLDPYESCLMRLMRLFDVLGERG